MSWMSSVQMLRCFAHGSCKVAPSGCHGLSIQNRLNLDKGKIAPEGWTHTETSESIQHQFDQGGLFRNGEGVRVLADLDHSLEWCESQLLERERITDLIMPLTLPSQLAASGFEEPNAACLMGFLEQVQVEEGEYLIRQGAEADALYFVEQGGVSVYLESEDGKQVRLNTMGPGTVVGALGLYLGTTRTASVVADSATVAYRLTRAALFAMRRTEPELAAAFHEFVVRLLSERLVTTTQALEAVLR
jgi:SulP family sulfate permease